MIVTTKNNLQRISREKTRYEIKDLFAGIIIGFFIINFYLVKFYLIIIFTIRKFKLFNTRDNTKEWSYRRMQFYNCKTA